MIYAADMWCTPDVEVEGKTAKGSQTLIEKLERVQRMVALQILEALRMTLMDMLEAHAGLMPIGTRIKKICVIAMARIASILDTPNTQTSKKSSCLCQEA
ncbi:hypothetical protein J132_02164 [Termitomyces sp. J132]|nr:hypothetical protein J132_02164 [Termitomyces sp. J132]